MTQEQSKQDPLLAQQQAIQSLQTRSSKMDRQSLKWSLLGLAGAIGGLATGIYERKEAIKLPNIMALSSIAMITGTIASWIKIKDASEIRKTLDKIPNIHSSDAAYIAINVTTTPAKSEPDIVKSWEKTVIAQETDPEKNKAANNLIFSLREKTSSARVFSCFES